MRTASLPAWLPGRRGLLAASVLAVAAVLALYAWPLADGATQQASARVDGLVRLAAVTAVGLSCMSASWRHEGRERAALLVVAAGAQVWACVQALHLGRDLLGHAGELAWVDALATVALCGSAAAGLWLLRAPRGREHGWRLAVEWSLVAASSLLVLRLALPPFWTSPSDPVDWSRAVGISLLVAALLLTWARPWSTGRAWPLLPGALAVLTAGLVIEPVAETAVPSRLAGVALTAGLALVALAVATGGAPAPTVDRPARRPSAAAVALLLLPLSALAVALLGMLSARTLEPVAVVGIVGLGVLAAVHGHLLGVEARSEVRELSEAETSLRHRAFHDELTGLANRALFLDRLAHALDLHRRHMLPLSVLYGDLDGFKQVNDQYGHAAGDALLVAVATRMRQCLRPEDTLARLGGDEFVLLIEQGSSPDVVADRLREALREPFPFAGRTFALQMSIGIARVCADAATPTPGELLERADADMYASKPLERSRPAAAPAPAPAPAPATAPALIRLPASGEPPSAAALARALHSGAVSVVYQPLVDASTGTVHGLEALARWSHDGRVLLPAAFLPLAERFGLSGTLTDVVLEQSCAQLSAWSAAAGHHRLTMAVNVSAAQIGDPSLAERVHGAVQRHALHADQVVLETTVGALPRDCSAGSARRGGPGLSIGGFTGDADDFALLSSLPVRSVKVPGPRTADGAGGDHDRLLRVLVALGHELDLRVVVERVERLEELAALRRLSGVLAQGYLLSRPAEATTLDDVVLRGCPLPA